MSVTAHDAGPPVPARPRLLSLPNGEKATADLLARGDGSEARDAAGLDAGGVGRRLPLHLRPQRQLFRGLRVLQLRPPLRARGHRGRAHHHRRQPRLRPAVAAELRGLRRLHRLAPGQLLRGGALAVPGPRPDRHRARPPHLRGAGEARGGAPGRGARRRRRGDDADADDQVRRGAGADPQRRGHRRHRRRGGRRGHRRGRARARGGAARDRGDDPRRSPAAIRTSSCRTRGRGSRRASTPTARTTRRPRAGSPAATS